MKEALTNHRYAVGGSPGPAETGGLARRGSPDPAETVGRRSGSGTRQGFEGLTRALKPWRLQLLDRIALPGECGNPRDNRVLVLY